MSTKPRKRRWKTPALDIQDRIYHQEIYLVTTKMVPGEVYPIIGHTWKLFGIWFNQQDKPHPPGLRIFEIGPGATTTKVNDQTHGIRAADGAVVPMPVVEVVGGSVVDGAVHVDVPADGEEHVLVAGLPVGTRIRRITDVETESGPLVVLDAVEDLVLRAHLPGQILLAVEPGDGRAKTAIHVRFV
jgi:hypothetical protein